MEIKKKLKVSAEHFYDSIIRSVVYDIDQTTGRTLKNSQLEGFEYVKTFSQNNQAKIIIDRVETNRYYQFRTQTTRNEFTANYTITPIDNQSCEVIYHETMTSVGAVQKVNDFFVGLILDYFKKKQFIKMLESIETAH